MVVLDTDFVYAVQAGRVLARKVIGMKIVGDQ
jgi:hypothetical protein